MGWLWGITINGSTYGNPRVFWERFLPNQCDLFVQAHIPTTASTTLYRIRKLYNLPGLSSQWEGDRWIPGSGWFNVFSQGVNFKDAQFIDAGFEYLVIPPGTIGDVRLPWNVFDKIQLTGYQMPQHTPLSRLGVGSWWWDGLETEWQGPWNYRSFGPYYNFLDYSSMTADLNP